MTAVASVREAIATFTTNLNHYDILLSDIHMPEEDGYMLIRHIRSLSPDMGGQIPAAALTASGGKGQEEVITTGFQCYIPKTITPSQLALIVAMLVKPTGND